MVLIFVSQVSARKKTDRKDKTKKDDKDEKNDTSSDEEVCNFLKIFCYCLVKVSGSFCFFIVVALISETFK